MSLKTLRLANDSAIVLPAKRSARLKKHVAACAIALLTYAPASSFALELGEAAIRSGLGESLRVEIPYRLAGNEQLTPSCVALVPARPGQALPTYSRVSRVAITPTHIEIHGTSRVLDPLIGLIVEVHCATTPHFVRSYELFVDPPSRIPAILSSGTQLAAARAEAATQAAVPVAGIRRAAPADARIETSSNGARSATPALTSTARANVSERARGQTGGALSQGETYLVVRGDTLSGIAARIADRPVTIREAAQAIFASNPDAFVRGNPDLLQAGRSLSIPMLAAAATPLAAPAAASVSVAREAEPAAGTPPPRLAPVPASETAAPAAIGPPAAIAATAAPAATAARATIAATPEPPAAGDSVVEPTTAPTPRPDTVAPDSTGAATGARSSLWLTVLLALGAALALSVPLLLRRRRQEPAPQARAAAVRISPPRRLVDPVAGFDVVEGQLTDATSDATGPVAAKKHAEAPLAPAYSTVAAQPESLAIEIGPVDSVDLDVGAPVIVDERLDWFADAPATAGAPAVAAASDATIEETATAEISDLADDATVEQPLAGTTHVLKPAIDDEQHTLTIVELDMLRQDYEAEHTLTQAASNELRDAVADLKATQAALAASAATATLEIPQAESIELQPTQRLRSSR